MKTKKGFTILELVIVIAVIAILAAVLVPTFGGIIDKSNESAAMQEARNIYTNYLADSAETGVVETDVYVKTAKGWVLLEDGQIVEQGNGKWTVEVPEGKTKPENCGDALVKVPACEEDCEVHEEGKHIETAVVYDVYKVVK